MAKLRPLQLLTANHLIPFLHKAAMATSASSTPITRPTTTTSPSSKIPKFVYGTAWKKDRTADLVYQALKAGFRGIDTAAQPRHYQEELVGDGIRRAIKEGVVKREELFVRLSLLNIYLRYLSHILVLVIFVRNAPFALSQFTRDEWYGVRGWHDQIS
jgi:hypothetical protein